MFGFFKKKAPEPVQGTPGYATFYLPDPALLGSAAIYRLKGLQTFERLSENGAPTGLLLRFTCGEIRMNFMPGDQMAEHLAGLCGYVEEHMPDPDQLPALLGRIRDVKLVVGCVITPRFDDGDVLFDAILDLNSHLDSLLFLIDSLFDSDATPLAGSACEE